MAVKSVYDGEFYLNDDGNLVKICADDWQPNPRREYDCYMGTFYTWMRNYESPDDGRPYDAEELGREFGLEIGDSLCEFISAFNTNKLGVAMPVWAIDHSGITYRAAWENPFYDPWDSGLAGVIFATNERICELRCVNEVTREIRDEVRKEFEAEVNEYNDWACGNIHGFRTYDKNGEEIDSCWGFIGDNADSIADTCGGLNKCKFSSVYEFVKAHENDLDVMLERYNELNEELNNLAERINAAHGIRIVKTGRVVKTTSKQEVYV